MARSVRHTPILQIACCYSEKKDKQVANRRFRRKVNVLTKQDDAHRDLLRDGGEFWEDNDWQDNSKRMHWEYPLLREVSNVWCFGKDGKYYCLNADPKWLRK